MARTVCMSIVYAVLYIVVGMVCGCVCLCRTMGWSVGVWVYVVHCAGNEGWQLITSVTPTGCSNVVELDMDSKYRDLTCLCNVWQA